ncbi:acyl-CoA dehydrogenase/oxidase [Paraphoma chrysanthemicola]|nr:acyl-CoA dehydrogenase/oxidase [Paraphoma chrysanthemicola]
MPTYSPFEDPPWLQGMPSPYYNESHYRFQRACREFIDEKLNVHAVQWEREGAVPPEVWYSFAEANMLIPNLAAPLPVKWLKRLGLTTMPGGLQAQDFDDMHSYIYFDEMARSGLLAVPGSLMAGMAYGVPPILQYGSPELQERFLPDLLSGRKRTCIAVTEPDAGSDVAGLTTTAEKSEDGRYYIVNGNKKWITNGIWADFATMAVRTGGSGAAGLSLLVVPLNGHPGVITKKIALGGGNTAGTAFIELDDVRVPVENLIGEEGMGMAYIMNNFNHERMAVSITVTRQARVALDTTFKYCLKREAFGKTLMDQPVIRKRLAKCGAEVETLTAWIENLSYQLHHLSKQQADIRLGGLIALAKAKAGKVLEKCASCAVLLHGGNGYTRSGQGELVEKIYREVSGARIPGGSEDVMFDLAVRQLVRQHARLAGTDMNVGRARL